MHYMIGHGGFGGQFAAADVKHRVGWAYCSNYLDPTIMLMGSAKWRPLEEALFKCVLTLEGGNLSRKHIETKQDYDETLAMLKSKL